MFKRVLKAIVLFFALYAFVFVPLGRLTALEHVRAIFTTPAAKQAGSELKGGVERLVKRLRNEAEQATLEADADEERRARANAALAPPASPSGRAPNASATRPTGLPRRVISEAPSLGPGDLDLDSLEALEALPNVDELKTMLERSPEASARAPR